jgi:hypothetical protein
MMMRRDGDTDGDRHRAHATATIAATATTVPEATATATGPDGILHGDQRAHRHRDGGVDRDVGRHGHRRSDRHAGGGLRHHRQHLHRRWHRQGAVRRRWLAGARHLAVLPIDVLFDRSGRLLIMDWNNLRLRRVNDDGTVQTIMGTDFEDFPVEGALG